MNHHFCYTLLLVLIERGVKVKGFMSHGLWLLEFRWLVFMEEDADEHGPDLWERENLLASALGSIHS